MSLLALLASQTTSPGPGPDPDPTPTVPVSLLHSTTTATLDWTDTQNLVLVSQLAGYDSVREQDDIVYDPGASDPARRWCFYFSAMFGASSRVWVMHSPDGIEWTNPVFCFYGQDPSVTQTLEPNPKAYRDGSGRLVLFCENNSTDEVDAYTSLDGVAWTLDKAGAIPRSGASSGWDHFLTGSPNARHDGTKFVVGYEGIQDVPTRIETFSVAWGPTPSTLVKSPSTPVIDPTVTPGLANTSVVSDAIYLNPAGDRIFLGCHRGTLSAGTDSMWRMVTTNLDPTTWQQGDFSVVGGMVDPDRRGDFTLDAYRGLVVTTPAGTQSLVRLPLKPA